MMASARGANQRDGRKTKLKGIMLAERNLPVDQPGPYRAINWAGSRWVETLQGDYSGPPGGKGQEKSYPSNS